MTASTDHFLEFRGAHGEGWRVAFQRVQGCFTHTISLIVGDSRIPLLESVRDEGEDRWPPSPPLAELQFQQQGDGPRAALLVGSDGRGHWSASILADPASSQLLLDVACRVKSAPAWLGCTYRLLPGVTPETSNEDVLLLVDGRECRVHVDRDEAGKTPTLHVQQRRLVIIPPAPNAPPPISTRWTYRISWVATG